MAALKENLLSPWRVNRTTDTLDRFRREREEALRKSENRRMELQGDILKLQQDKHLRELRLQWRWQELTEREGRARRHNQQLLQDFHSAQVALGEMVAHTAAMNAIRREYQRHLEENSPRWHRQLRGHSHAAQKKKKEVLLRDFVQRREEEQVTKEHFSPPRENPFRSQGATSVGEDPCIADGLPDAVVPPTAPASSGLAHAHVSHDASLLHSPATVPHPGPSPVHRRASSPEQGPLPWRAPPALWPSPWAPGVVGSPPGLTWALPSAAGPPGGGLVPARGAEAVGGTAQPLAEGWREKTQRGGTGLSQELDIRPVRLSSAHGDSSDGSRDAGSGRNHQERRTREEGRLHSGSDRKSIPQESAGTSSADSEVTPTTSATRRRRANKGQESSAPPSETESNSRSRCLGASAREQSEEKGSRIDPDQSGSPKEKSCRIVRVKSQSVAEESSRTEDDDEPTDHSERSVRERGHRSEDSVSVSMRSKREAAAVVERVGEKVADDEEDPVETDGDVQHTDEDARGENEEKRLTEESEDEEESQREENKEEEDKRGKDDEGQGSDASGEEEGQEQPGSSESESESAAIPRAKEEQETKELQTKIEDEVKELDEEEDEGEEEDEEDEEDEEEDEEDDEEEDGGGGGVGIDQPGQGPHTGDPEKTDSDDGIILPQEHRCRKKVQSVSEEVEDDAEDGEESGAEGSVENSDSDDDDGDIERLVAPRVETKREREKEQKPPEQTKVITRDASLSEESDKMAEDTDDEFDHFYD